MDISLLLTRQCRRRIFNTGAVIDRTLWGERERTKHRVGSIIEPLRMYHLWLHPACVTKCFSVSEDAITRMEGKLERKHLLYHPPSPSRKNLHATFSSKTSYCFDETLFATLVRTALDSLGCRLHESRYQPRSRGPVSFILALKGAFTNSLNRFAAQEKQSTDTD